MCGRFQLRPDGEIETLMPKLQAKGKLAYAEDIAPGASISIIKGCPEREVSSAIWWLLLDPKTLKPNYKYSSFNSRSDRLSDTRGIAYTPFRESRCIIPASSFCEGLGDKKTYHKIELEGRAIAFGGIYKTYLNTETGELVYSASIITLPPVEKWKNIHPKSIPLILDTDNEDLLGRWLDPDCKEPNAFTDVLEPVIHHPQRITPIGKPSKWNPIGDSYLIS